MNLISTHYDVIIVGGRPAGATLAVRLGREGLRVLLLERAVFPSPHPVSMPIIYSSAMALLDEIGASEADYACNTPRTTHWVNEYYDQFRSYVPVPQAFGRDYGYAIDRAHFDDVLWRMAAALPTVTARQPFAVHDLLWNADLVIGVTGQTPGGPIESFTGDCVIGADGRFSTVAQKVAAQPHDVCSATPTTIYYAAWKGAEPVDDRGAALHFCKPSSGYIFLLLDSSDGLVNVAVEGQTKLFSPDPGQVEAFYMDMLRHHPLIWRRLAKAERVGPVRGMRNVGNFYRTAGGPGWALVGDAVHQKDPIDGQGIYDALFTAKALSQAIMAWKTQGKLWAQTIADYEAAVHAETYLMYEEAQNHIKLIVYSKIPQKLDKFLYRWFGDDEELNRRYALLTVRAIPPKNWLPASALLRAAARGALDNIRYFLTGKPHPAEIRR
jgi:flavin-dependent dehydrogenase